MLLTKLTPVTLYYIESTRGADGDKIEKYINVFEAEGAVQYLASDEVDKSAYGANLLKTYRFKSIYNDLEEFLLEKTENSPDNLTKYLVEWKGHKYSVVKVTPLYIDIQWR
jgi:hypothetical protein